MKSLKKPIPYCNWFITQKIFTQSFNAMINKPGIYVFVSVGITIMLLMLHNTIENINSGYVLILSEPFIVPLLLFSIFGSFFVSLMAGLSIAKDREEGLLESLFYGPINTLDYVIGKSLSFSVIFIVMVIIYSIVCLILATLANFVITKYFIAIICLSIAVTTSIVGLVILIATFMRSIRGTIFFALGVILLLSTLQFGEDILLNIVSSSAFLSLITIRDIFVRINHGLAWISPVAYFFSGYDAIFRNNHLLFFVYFFGSLAYGFVTNNIAAAHMQRKGILG